MFTATRRMPSSRIWRVSGSSLRTVSCRCARSEMMLCLVPAWNEPTVIDARLARRQAAADHRLQRQHDLRAQHHRVDAPVGGRAVGADAVDEDVDGIGAGVGRAGVGDEHRRWARSRRRGTPGRSPACQSAARCRPPSSPLAPPTRSSAGWPISIRVPDQRSRRVAIARAVPTRLVMWTSWPQACITDTSLPSQSSCFAGRRVVEPGLLVHRQPVHVGAHHHRGPVAVLQQRDDAGAADPLVTSKPASRSSRARRAAVCVLHHRQLGMPVEVEEQLSQVGVVVRLHLGGEAVGRHHRGHIGRTSPPRPETSGNT